MNRASSHTQLTHTHTPVCDNHHAIHWARRNDSSAGSDRCSSGITTEPLPPPPPTSAAATGATTTPAASASSGCGQPQQQQQLLLASSTGSHTGPAGANELLDKSFVSCQVLMVGQIQQTEYTRQVNQRGLANVKSSYAARGWVEGNIPYVLVPREQLPDGKPFFHRSCCLLSKCSASTETTASKPC